MCTVIYDRSLGLLAKNRDKTYLLEEETFSNQKLVGVRTKGTTYFSLAANIYGVGFASTAVNSIEWIEAASNRATEVASEILKKENHNRVSPTAALSQVFSEIHSAEEGLKFLFEKTSRLNEANPSSDPTRGWMGYHVFLADSSGAAYILECYGKEVIAYSVPDRMALTNHFRYLKHGPKEVKDYPSTYFRARVSQDFLSRGSTNYEQLQNFTSTNDEDESIWRKGAFFTVSATDLWLKERSLVWKTKEGSVSDPKHNFKRVKLDLPRDVEYDLSSKALDQTYTNKERVL